MKYLSSLIIWTTLVLVVVAGWYSLGKPSSIDETVKAFQEKIGLLQEDLGSEEDRPQTLELLREVVAPPPLRGPVEEREVVLTANGVFTYTNIERETFSVPRLTRNATLDKAAANKLQDMFAKQYFDHVSPTGEGPADVVDGVGYNYIKVGENLALGNFESDETLVTAWMNSPGHRANILSEGFTEIGIAVGKGQFEGQTTWLAVQTFGTPASECPAPDTTLKQQIDALEPKADEYQAELDATQAELTRLAQEAEDLASEAEKLANEGNTKIEEGNREIEKGNETYRETGSEDEARPYWERGEALQQEGQVLLEQAQRLYAQAEAKQQEHERVRSEYNETVNDYNETITDLKAVIERYNQQVRTFNECVESFGE